MKYLEITKKVYLVEQEFSNKTVKKTPEAINHIYIIDRSGSMSYMLRDLGEDLIKQIKTLPIGDTVTFGWFSGEGDYRFVLKGFNINKEKDFGTLEKVIRDNLTSRGTTCFSEILKDTSSVVEDLSSFGNAYSLCFLTDGFPIVSNYNREIESIFSAINNLSGKIDSALLVGYGNYYNKELMSDMAEKFGGSLIHSNDLPAFNYQLTNFINDSRENAPKIEVDLAMIPLYSLAFNIAGKNINLFTASKTVTIAPSKKNKNYMYYLTDKIPAKAELVLDKDLEKDSLLKGAYAAAYVLTQKTKTDTAIEILAKIGDVALIDSLNNAFTNAEYGLAETKIQKAVTSPSSRFESGRNTKYLPKSDAFCLLDALDLLMQDETASFYPRHNTFEYSRIGKKTVNKEGYPEFKSDQNAKCSLNDLAWNSTKLNLSIKARIKGTVELKEGFDKLGFQKNYPTYVFRNYTVVKDGFLNVQKLPVSMSAVTFGKLVEFKLLPKNTTYERDEVYTLDLTQIPIMNREIASGNTSAKDLGIKVVEELKLEAQLKAFKYYLKTLEDQKIKSDVLTEEQLNFLAENGIGNNGYAPPTETETSVDYYMAKEFDIKIKGCSSLPKVDAVLAKIKTGKAFTATESLMNVGIQEYEKIQNKDKAQTVYNLTSVIKNKTLELREIRSYIQRTKFAVILGKKWFDEFSSRAENTITVDNYTLTYALSETRVDL